MIPCQVEFKVWPLWITLILPCKILLHSHVVFEKPGSIVSLERSSPYPTKCTKWKDHSSHTRSIWWTWPIGWGASNKLYSSHHVASPQGSSVSSNLLTTCTKIFSYASWKSTKILGWPHLPTTHTNVFIQVCEDDSSGSIMIQASTHNISSPSSCTKPLLLAAIIASRLNIQGAIFLVDNIPLAKVATSRDIGTESGKFDNAGT